MCNQCRLHLFAVHCVRCIDQLALLCPTHSFMCRCRACITRRQQRTSSFKIRGRACWVTAIKHAHRRRSVLLAWMLLNDGGQQPVQTGAKAYSLRFQILIARWQPFGSCILSVQLTLRWQQVLRKLNQICKGLLSLHMQMAVLTLSSDACHTACQSANWLAAAFRFSFIFFSMSVATLKMPPVGTSQTAHRPPFFLFPLCFSAQFSQK